MKKRTIFTGSGVAIITPFYADGSVNFDKLGELIDWQIESGTDAIIICGTTGESAVMTDKEHGDCVRYAVERVGGRIPVVAGAGGNNTRVSIEYAKHAEEVGADMLLCVTPYYNKTSQHGLVAHYQAISDSSSLPIIVYNVPSRTGLNVKPSTYYELAKIENVAAIKEAGGDISEIADTMSLCAGMLDLYSGNDDQIIPLMSLGGVGVISVIANALPRETHELCRLYLDGMVKEATEMQLKLIPFIRAAFVEVNPVPIKTMLNIMGKEVGPLRMPLVDLLPKNRDVVIAAMRDWELI